MEFYADRFRAAFKDLGDNVSSLGSQVGGVADQVADWLRNRSGTSSDAGPADEPAVDDEA
jgi:hypothetical protein